MNHAGIHWPANAGGEHPDVATILSMPGIGRGCTVVCADSARYWYRQARGACPLVVWRGLPRQGRLPAHLGWQAKRVADEVLNLWEEQPHGGIEWFLPLNELQFEKEAGGPFPGYGEMAGHLDGLRRELRKRLPGVGLLFPAWVPGDDGDHLDDWRSEAAQWDAICLHAYGSADAMRARYRSYRDAFPDVPILIGEWNANHEGHDERAALEMWAEVADSDAGFLGAVYYIWETDNAGEHDLSVWGNAARLALFRNPPTVPLNPPAPQPPVVTPPAPVPVPEPAPMPDLTDEPDHLFTFEQLWPTIQDAGSELGFDAQVLAGIIKQESGWRNWRVHRDGTGHGLLGLDDNGLLPDFERWSGLTIGRGGSAASIPIVPQIRYAAHALADYANRLGGAYAAARAWHRGERLMDDAAGQHYEQLIRAHVAELFGGVPAPAARVTFNRDEPAIAQNDPWSCAPTSTRWALRAVGRHPAEGWMESQMVADGVVSEADGLLDATGDHLSAWIASEYGEFGYSANAESPVSFDALAAEFMAPSNPYPGLLGGRAWGHWSGLRSYDPATDQLQLANPADGWMFVSQTMSREQFAALGPFSLVRILHPDLLGAPAPTPPPPPPAPEPVPATPRRDDAIRAQIAAIRAACDQIEAALP
jgi:hypothetical protein